MTQERLQHVRQVFESVKDLQPRDRESILGAVRDTEPTLAVEVDRLLAAHERRDDFMRQPIADLHSPAANDEPDLAGSRIGPYEIIQEIGRGGMGTVYEAVRIDGSFRKQVAIKVLRANLFTDSLHEKFRRERQILAGLDHPSIARIPDGGTTETGWP
jgi:eukaryotic-like serine/threonine-protein kinase